MKLTITRATPEDTERHTWIFGFGTREWEHDEPRIRLLRYFVERRETKRHKYRRPDREAFYSCDSNDDWRSGNYMTREEVIIPKDVREEVTAQLVAMITASAIEVPAGHAEKRSRERTW